MLIIEGSDCVGKTTLANNILMRCHELGHTDIIYQHMTRPDEATFDFYTDYFPMIMPNMIRDRFHLGGICYHDDQINEDRLRIIEGWIYSRGGLIILMYAGDFRAYARRLKEQHKGNVVDDMQMQEANQRFYGLTHEYGHCDFVWDLFGGHNTNEPQFMDQILINKLTDWWLRRRKEYEDGLELLQSRD